MNSATPSRLLEQASTAANQNEHMQAIQLYTDLLANTSPQSDDVQVGEYRLVALRERGRLFNLLGEPQAALAGYEQYYVEAGSTHHAVDALVFIGTQCAYMNFSDRAIEAHRDALRLARSLNYTTGRAMALGGIGLVFSLLDRSEEALIHLRKSLALFQQVDNKVEQARGWNRVGVSHMHLGEVDKAITAFQNSSKLANEAGESEPIAMETAVISLSNLGECYQRLFDMEQAMYYHQQALTMVQAIELPYLEADLARNLGVDLGYLGRVDEGLDYLHRALTLSMETNQPDIEVQVLYSLALAEIQRGDLDEAQLQAGRLEKLAQEQANRGSLAEAHHVLGICYQEKGDLEAAQGAWQQSLFLAHETGRRILLWQVHAALGLISASPELARVHNRIALEIIEQIANPIGDVSLREKFLEAPPVLEVRERVESTF
jgi:tetratricopeptide (TPR) repeat protein